MGEKKYSDRNKKILGIAALLFTILVILTTVDIMKRTTRPGAKKHLPAEILK